MKKTDLNEEVTEVLDDMEISILSTQAIIDVRPLPTIDAYGSQWRQLFQNLIGNAIKFHKQGAKPKIEINAEIIPADKLKFPDQLKTFYKFREWDEDYYWAREKFCRITVRDYGIGFKQEYSDRIFVAFQRLHNQSQYSGTGIGLAICRKIVEYHHGIISATSTSEDTTFTIVVPVSQANFEKREKVNEKPSF